MLAKRLLKCAESEVGHTTDENIREGRFRSSQGGYNSVLGKKKTICVGGRGAQNISSGAYSQYQKLIQLHSFTNCFIKIAPRSSAGLLNYY